MSEPPGAAGRTAVDYLLDEIPLLLDRQQMQFLWSSYLTPAKLAGDVHGVTLQAIQRRLAVAMSPRATADGQTRLVLPRVIASHLAFWLTHAFATESDSASPLAVWPHHLLVAREFGAALDHQLYPTPLSPAGTWPSAIELAEDRVLAARIQPTPADATDHD